MLVNPLYPPPSLEGLGYFLSLGDTLILQPKDCKGAALPAFLPDEIGAKNGLNAQLGKGAYPVKSNKHLYQPHVIRIY